MSKKNRTAETATPEVSPPTTEVIFEGSAPLSDVWADWKQNPRAAGKLPSEDDFTSWSKLRDSIKAIGGTLQSILCVEAPGPNGEKYRVIAGYRRFEAVSSLAEEDPTRFKTIGAKVVRNTDVDFGSEGDVSEDGETKTYNRRLMAGRTGELILAATENGMRADVGVWDRIRMASQFAKEGLSIQEIVGILAESGNGLSPNTIRNYIKIGSFPAKVQKRLKALGGAGFRMAITILAQEYNMAQPPAVKWDEVKQHAKIDELTKAIEEKAGKPGKMGGGTPKPSRYTIKPAELSERWAEIEAVASEDVKVTLAFLLGKATRIELVAATDEDFACALTGEGGDAPSEAGEE